MRTRNRPNLVPDAAYSGYSALRQPQRMPSPSNTGELPLFFGDALYRLLAWITFVLDTAGAIRMLHLGGPTSARPRLEPAKFALSHSRQE